MEWKEYGNSGEGGERREKSMNAVRCVEDKMRSVVCGQWEQRFERREWRGGHGKKSMVNTEKSRWKEDVNILWREVSPWSGTYRE